MLSGTLQGSALSSAERVAVDGSVVAEEQILSQTRCLQRAARLGDLAASRFHHGISDGRCTSSAGTAHPGRVVTLYSRCPGISPALPWLIDAPNDEEEPETHPDKQ